MVTFDQVKAARHGSNYAEVLEAYLEPANLYQVLGEHDELMKDAHESYMELLEAEAAKKSENMAEEKPSAEKPEPSQPGV